MSRFVLITISFAWMALTVEAAAWQADGEESLLDLNTCALCHTMPEPFQEDRQQFYIPAEQLVQDAHFRAGVKCYECHGGNPFSFTLDEAHARSIGENKLGIVGFRYPLDEVQKSCDKCHQEEKASLAGGVHAKAGNDPQGGNGPLSCQQCHGEIKHSLYPSDDRRSRVFLDHQVELCGGCHEEYSRSFGESVHGRGLEHSGLLVTAVCADCHDAHAIHKSDDRRSTLHPTNVAATCAKCHRFIEERLRHSVHGSGNGLGQRTDRLAPGGKENRTPSCTDCHFGHNSPSPGTAGFRLRVSARCGNCHSEVSEGYLQSLHGELTELGYGAAAKCSDCHGSHDIMAIDDPASRVAEGKNRLDTCRKCHPRAVKNFCSFQPHANFEDPEQFLLLYLVHMAMELLIYSVFAFFGVHTILWFWRSIIHFHRHGRPPQLAASKATYVRFEPIHRFLHAIVIVSFLGLSATGLPLKYSDQAWAQALARALGGFESSSVWHRIFAVMTVFYFATHVLWITRQAIRSRMAGGKWLAILFGPDSPIPGPRDLFDVFAMGRWFVGRGPKPVFERWTYWEKFDYWAVFWGVGIIGTSGMMLWFPNVFSLILPGEVLNIAKVVHSEEALLATSFIFAIHFFGTHLRPEKFPMDMAILTGLVTEEEIEEERPEFVERMRAAGRWESLKAPVPSRGAMILIRVGGFIALLIGLGLLVGILLAMFVG